MKKKLDKIFDPKKVKEAAMTEYPKLYSKIKDEEWGRIAEQLAALARLIADFVKEKPATERRQKGAQRGAPD